MQTMAIQKFGVATPNTAIAPATWSIHVPRLTAATTPNGMATEIAMNIDSGSSFRVLGSLSKKSSAAGFLYTIESPKSPRTIPVRNTKSWTWYGRSRPRFLSTNWRSSSVASSGTIRSAGFPVALARANTISATIKSRTIPCKSRLRMYFCKSPTSMNSSRREVQPVPGAIRVWSQALHC